ncbi:hypothetical protein BD414DRAFT_415921 [Trametes punicea]|nr:hypothetical protein BD414DRAFT_415921 [Trametes punicea]
MIARQDQAGVQLQHFGRDFQVFKHEVQVLLSSVRQANDALGVGLQISSSAQEKQFEVAQAAGEVALALNSLVQKARTEISSINVTAAAMKESLLQDISGPWRFKTWPWLETALIHCFKDVLNADLAFLDLPAFRVLCLAFRVLWSLLGFASSGLMVSQFCAIPTHS